MARVLSGHDSHDTLFSIVSILLFCRLSVRIGTRDAGEIAKSGTTVSLEYRWVCPLDDTRQRFEIAFFTGDQHTLRELARCLVTKCFGRIDSTVCQALVDPGCLRNRLVLGHSSDCDLYFPSQPGQLNS